VAVVLHTGLMMMVFLETMTKLIELSACCATKIFQVVIMESKGLVLAAKTSTV